MFSVATVGAPVHQDLAENIHQWWNNTNCQLKLSREKGQPLNNGKKIVWLTNCKFKLILSLCTVRIRLAR
jgi:hypothetical protein